MSNVLAKCDRRTLVKSAHVASIAATSHLSTFWIGPPYVDFNLYVLHAVGLGAFFGWLSYVGLKTNPGRAVYWYGISATIPIFAWTYYAQYLGIPATQSLGAARLCSFYLLMATWVWKQYKLDGD